MPFTLTTLLTEVRGHLLNITTTQIADVDLTRHVFDAKRQMESEFPLEQKKLFTGSGVKYYKLSTVLTDWVDNRSELRRIASPAPTIADDDEIHWLSYADWEFWDNGTDEYVRLTNALSSPDQALVVYTIPWTLNGLDGAIATNLTIQAEQAIIYLSTAIACFALASKSAGTMDSQIPGDLINFRSKEAEYRRVGNEWLKQYYQQIGAGDKKVSAAMVRRDYDFVGQSGHARMTHPDR